MNRENPRQEIEKAIDANNLHELLEITGLLHGHFCPGSAMGVKAAARAVREIGVKPNGMEKVIAIVETNNCFSDGVQMVTGCSFGNNALIYRDYGKTAFTLAKRTGDGIRVSTNMDRAHKDRPPEIAELWDKVIVRREGTEEESRRLSRLWKERSFSILDIPDDEILVIQNVKIDVPAYAPIFASVKCCECGETFMETRARIKEGNPVCLPCSAQSYYQLSGEGISIINK